MSSETLVPARTFGGQVPTGNPSVTVHILFARDARIYPSAILAFYNKLAKRQPVATLVALSITVIAMAF